MSARPFITAAAVLVGVLSSVTTGCAQDADSLRVRAAQHINAGEYDEARRLYAGILEASPADAAALGLAESYILVGEHADGLRALENLLRRDSQSPVLLHAKGRILRAQGQLSEAEAVLIAAVENHAGYWAAAVDLAEMFTRTGRDRDARGIYIAVYQQYDRGAFRTAADLRAGALAASRLGRFRDANEAYRLAHELDPSDVATLYDWAELFRSKYNEAEARRTYEDALARNPRHPPSLVGLAHATPSFERREELAQRALEVNPNNPDALNLLAGLRILDGLFDEAETLSNRALDVDQSNVAALAHLGSASLLRGDSTAYQSAEKRALEIDPGPTDFYALATENATHRFRYHLAADLAARAVQVDPENAAAHAELGLALLRIGRREDARLHLETAFERDPYNLFASNTLTLLDEYEHFARLESSHFELFIHEDEAEVLGPIMLEVAEAGYDSLRARYPYDPPGKITIEAYNDGDDFAVRVAGVPHRGLLGVSFGDVVALNTPGARSEESYNWARTLWHEIAHTMAIGVSEHRVPRWFTEGLSVYEEARARPEWGREMELTFLSAYATDRLLPLSEIERGFTRPQYPGQVILSYYHAGRVIQHLVDEFGFEAIVSTLEAYRSGASTEEALGAATGLSLTEMDRRFRDATEARHQELAEAVRGLPDVLEREEAQVQSVADADGPLFAQLRRGARHLEQDDYEAAEAAFQQALRIYPDYTGPGNAYEGLALVYRSQGDSDALINILQRYVHVAEDVHEPLRELADLYEQRGDFSAAAAMLERSLYVAPYDPGVRRRLAEAHEREGAFEAAVRHRRAELALGPSDRAGAYLRLAKSLHGTGRFDEAKRAVLQSLEIAPDYREAQRLLLEIVE